MMTSPVLAKANNFRITSFFKLLQTQSYAQLSASELELERFELAPAEVSIHFGEDAYFFGGINHLDKQRYVQSGEIVHLITDTLYPQLIQPPGFYISTRLLPKDTQIKQLQTPEYTIAKEFDKWTVKSARQINEEEILKVVSAWQNTDAMTVRLYQEIKSKETISIETEKNEIIRFNIIEGLPNLILARTDLGIQYHLHNFTAEKLFFGETVD